jgi:non-ribosomal peptide synthetase component F
MTLAAFFATMHAWTGDRDLVLGSPEANRSLDGTPGSVGLYVITLLLRLRMSGEMRFAELVQRVSAEVLDAYVHRHVSIPQLAARIGELRDVGDMPLYQTIFAYQNFPRPPLAMQGLETAWQPGVTTASKFDLFFSLRQQADGSGKASAQYRDALFERATMQRLVEGFAAVLNLVAAGEDFALRDAGAFFETAGAGNESRRPSCAF